MHALCYWTAGLIRSQIRANANYSRWVFFFQNEDILSQAILILKFKFPKLTVKHLHYSLRSQRGSLQPDTKTTCKN